MSDTPIPNPPKETDVERHLRFADEYGADAAMHVQNAYRHSSEGNRNGTELELADSSVAVLRGQVELMRAAEAMRRVRP